MDDTTIESITRRVLDKLNSGNNVTSQVPSLKDPSADSALNALHFSVGVSARHIHLTQKDVETLFGKGYQLNVYKMLLQPDQYAAAEKVAVVGLKKTIYGVRVLGPVRSSTQLELSMTDCFSIGVNPVVKDSGKHDGTPGATIVGPEGVVHLTSGVMVAARHIHVEPERAKIASLKDQQRVNVKVVSLNGRELTFGNVLVRCGSAHKAEFHIDTDEANAAFLKSGDTVEVLF